MPALKTSPSANKNPSFLQSVSILEPISFIGNLLSSFSSMAFTIPLAGGLLAWVAGKTSSSKLQNAAGKATNVTSLFESTVENFSRDTKRVFGNNSVVSKVVDGAENTISKFAQKTLPNHAYKAIKGKNIGLVAANGAMILNGINHVAGSIGGNIEVLQNMQEELTGKKPSIWSVLMGNKNLHPMVAEVRKTALGMRFGLGLLTQAAGIAGNVYMAIFDKSNGKTGFAKMAAFGMLPNMLSGIISPQFNAINMYRTASEATANGQAIDPELYAGMIHSFAPKASQEQIMELTEKFYQEYAKPEDVLKQVAQEFYPNSSIGKYTANLLEKPSTAMSYSQSFAPA